MTVRVHILAAPQPTNAGYCFLWPLLRFGTALQAGGIDLRIFVNAAATDLTGCDLLILEARAFGEQRNRDQGALLDFVHGLTARTRIVWADNYDSSGLIFAEILPIVHGYWKSQLLLRKQDYGTPHYGGRLFTDFYYKTQAVTDDDPQWTQPIEDTRLLDRLAVHWNMGLADHGRMARWMEALFRHTRMPLFAQAPSGFHSALAQRPKLLSARFGARYDRQTVAFQRAQILLRLQGRIPTDRISRTAFRQELRTARAVLSPYGWGEVCLRDFEAFIAGSALVKPDMSHLRTWPNWYISHQTYLPVRWDLSDLDAVLDDIAAHPELAMEIANGGQQVYWDHTRGPEAAQIFVTHLLSLLDRIR